MLPVWIYHDHNAISYASTLLYSIYLLDSSIVTSFVLLYIPISDGTATTSTCFSPGTVRVWSLLSAYWGYGPAMVANPDLGQLNRGNAGSSKRSTHIGGKKQYDPLWEGNGKRKRKSVLNPL